MKHLTLLIVAPMLALGLSGAAHADERPDHFEGERAATLDEALAHLSTYNARLESILAKDELGPEDTAEIHELTYTLENALAKIKSEVEGLEETLEEVHVASERYEVETVRSQGRKYLDDAAKLAK